MKRILVKDKWYDVSRESAFNGVLHYGICYSDDSGFYLGWVPRWLVDLIESDEVPAWA